MESDNERLNAIVDGGPAFPSPGLRGEYVNGMHYSMESTGGMTLRDWFAGQALAGCCAREWVDTEGLSDLANTMYVVADAMLKARSSHENNR